MIRKRAWLTGAALSGTLAVTGFGGSAIAADVVEEPNCAVSGFNGKIQGAAGFADNDDSKGDFAGEAGASLSFPLGCMFGLQIDGAFGDKNDDTHFGGVAHLFTRDPDSYLFGITGGVVDSDDATLYAVGPEAELYLGNFSLEAWGGYVNIDGEDDNDDSGFIIADAAFYLSDDFRVSVGGKIVDDYEAARVGFEYQFDESPLSLYGKGEFGDDDTIVLLGGLKFYFGGESKSLIRRHREDDPGNKVFDLFISGVGKGKSGDTPYAAPEGGVD